MIRVVLKKFGDTDPPPTWLDDDVRAVPAEPFESVDSGEGGITRSDIVDDAMIAPLSTFAIGVSVYVESEDHDDCLFDDDPAAESASHIWWLGIVSES